ncbi:MAG: YkvA family protein [Parabacteroides sp.]|nr:YkvA family protein [Parabacteroides sp.]
MNGDFVKRFLQAGWIKRAAGYVSNPRKLKTVVFQLGLYLSKKGPARLKEQTKLLYHYLSDVAMGHYKEYNVNSLIFLVAATIYLLTPIDFIPDFLPIGFLDDSTIILWALNVTSDELTKYKQAMLRSKEEEET